MNKKIKLIIATILTSIALVGCDNANKEVTIEPTQMEQTQEYLNINQGITVDNSARYEDKECKYELEIVSVKETKERSDYATTNPKRVIALEYKYKNIGHNPVDVLDWDFTVCGENMEALELYDGIVPTSDTVNENMVGKGHIAFIANEEDSKVYVNFIPGGVTWEINIEVSE